MTTLAANAKRPFEFNEDPVYNDLPMVGTDIIYEGAAVGDNGSGLARPLVAADPFMGFSVAKVDNSAGSASAKQVRVRTKGKVQLAVTGASSADDYGEAVYADDDNLFTLTSSSNTSIGKVHRWVTSTTCIVAFESIAQRSV